MKYEKIELNESYMVECDEEKVIAKVDECEKIVTIDKNYYVSSWRGDKLELFKPITKELPKEGLLLNVTNNDFVYRTVEKSGYGFVSGVFHGVKENTDFSFVSSPELWQPATPEQEKRFIEMIKGECTKRGLYEDTKIKGHADGSISSLMNDGKWLQKPPTITKIYNTNGMIFHKGKFATPLKEDLIYKVTEVVNEFGNHIIEQTESGVILISKIK